MGVFICSHVLYGLQAASLNISYTSENLEKLLWSLVSNSSIPLLDRQVSFGIHMAKISAVQKCFRLSKEPLKTRLCMTMRPEMPFRYWLSSLVPWMDRCSIAAFFLSLCNETILARAYLWGETNKDNYCQRVLFILCAASVLGESTCCSQSRLVCRDYQPLSFMLFIYTMQQSTLHFLLHCGARDAWASRTKLCISGLKHCAFGPTVLFQAGERKNRIWWKEKRGEREEREERERGKRGEEERLQLWASADRVPY